MSSTQYSQTQSKKGAPQRPINGTLLHLVSLSIMRPSAVLGGSVALLLGFATIYLNARFGGYSLSWLEPFTFFVVGWILGNIYDFLRVMITGKTDAL